MRFKYVIAALLLLMSPLSQAKSPSPLSWQLDFKAGAFQPNLVDWSNYYGSSLTYSGASYLGLSVFNLLSIGADLLYLRDSGVGQFASSSTTGGDVSYELLPGNLYVGLQGQFSDGQWVIPYAGAAYGRSFYRQQIQYQSDVRGGANGYTLKAGIKLLLDDLDASSAKMLQEEFSVRHSYFILEYQQLELETDGFDLGGRFFFSGIAFSF